MSILYERYSLLRSRKNIFKIVKYTQFVDKHKL